MEMGIRRALRSPASRTGLRLIASGAGWQFQGPLWSSDSPDLEMPPQAPFFAIPTTCGPLWQVQLHRQARSKPSAQTLMAARTARHQRTASRKPLLRLFQMSAT